MSERTIDDLRQKQAAPLSVKVLLTMSRIRQWVDEFGEDGVYISFSGGKDSTVLLDIVRNKCGYKDIPAVFVDVPTQYPELKAFVKTIDNVEIVKPTMGFNQVCEKYGFPLISKEIADAVYYVKKARKRGGTSAFREKKLRGELTYNGKTCVFNSAKYQFLIDAPFDIGSKCCHQLKRKPLLDYEKATGRSYPITGTTADESRQRTTQWIKHGCNGFTMKHPVSNPMSFWLDNDVLQYIFENNLKICSVYGDVVEDYGDQLKGQMDLSDYGLAESEKKYKTTGCKRTGCMLCGFGCNLDKPGEERFLTLKESHPKMYSALDLIKNNGFTFREAIEWTNEHGNLNIKL